MSQLRWLCRFGQIQAVKHAGWWLVHRDEFHRLLDPAATLQWLNRPQREQLFIEHLERLAAMLHPIDAESTISVLLKDIRRFEGIGEDGEGFAWRRAEWRVRDGVVDRSQTEAALGIVQFIIPLGTELFREIDWHDRSSALLSIIAESTGVDLAF